jgi:hypothetical protein
MSYRSKAERERENWLMLPEAVAHICLADKCGEKDARPNLLKALADDVLGPLRWEQGKGDRPQPFGSGNIPAPSDTPPLGRAWLTAKIRWKTGRVRDDWSEHTTGKWRVLLILRFTVSQQWPLTPPSTADREWGAPKDRNRLRQTRTNPEKERAGKGLMLCFSDGNFPDQQSMSNKALLKKVNECLENAKLATVKMDSLLRASGRRHKKTALCWPGQQRPKAHHSKR